MILLIIAALAMLAVRICGPSDIYDEEQPRTLSYTADMLLNGRWFLPLDGDGIPATKPVLYNWIGAAAVSAFGWHEWAFKLPSILSAVTILVLLVIAARRMIPPEMVPSIEDRTALGFAAGLLWLCCPGQLKMIYLGRTDLLLTACLTGAWVCGAMALAEEGDSQNEASHTSDPPSPQPSPEGRGSRKWALACWLFAGGAALAKGTLVLLIFLFLIASAKLLHGRFSAMRRTGWWWGVPLMLGIFLVWVAPAYLENPEFFVKYLIGRQVVERVGDHGFIDMIKSAWRGPFFVVTRMAPWSVIAVLGLVYLFEGAERRWRRSAMGPVVMWVLVVTAFFIVVPARRADHVTPIYPAMALLAAYGLVTVTWAWGLTVGRGVGLAMIMLGALCVHQLTNSAAAKQRYGENVYEFARRAEYLTHGEAIAFVDIRARNLPIPLLLHVARGADDATPAQIAAAKWIIRPVKEGEQPVLVSGDVPSGPTGEVGRIGLFHAERSPPR
ncbi:MAG: hypothetical protein GC162_06615 [Planctomycetes bacterium]|nr:hypothetical protein [Planctomycetota bacterium]